MRVRARPAHTHLVRDVHALLPLDGHALRPCREPLVHPHGLHQLGVGEVRVGREAEDEAEALLLGRHCDLALRRGRAEPLAAHVDEVVEHGRVLLSDLVAHRVVVGEGGEPEAGDAGLGVLEREVGLHRHVLLKRLRLGVRRLRRARHNLRPPVVQRRELLLALGLELHDALSELGLQLGLAGMQRPDGVHAPRELRVLELGLVVVLAAGVVVAVVVAVVRDVLLCALDDVGALARARRLRDELPQRKHRSARPPRACARSPAPPCGNEHDERHRPSVRERASTRCCGHGQVGHATTASSGSRVAHRCHRFLPAHCRLLARHL